LAPDFAATSLAGFFAGFFAAIWFAFEG